MAPPKNPHPQPQGVAKSGKGGPAELGPPVPDLATPWGWGCGFLGGPSNISPSKLHRHCPFYTTTHISAFFCAIISCPTNYTFFYN